MKKPIIMLIFAPCRYIVFSFLDSEFWSDFGSTLKYSAQIFFNVLFLFCVSDNDISQTYYIDFV